MWQQQKCLQYQHLELFHGIILFSTFEWIPCDFQNEKAKWLCRVVRTNDQVLFAIDLSACLTTPHTSNIVILQLLEFDFVSICGRCGDCGDIMNEWIPIDSLDVCRQDSQDNKKNQIENWMNTLLYYDYGQQYFASTSHGLWFLDLNRCESKMLPLSFSNDSLSPFKLHIKIKWQNPNLFVDGLIVWQVNVLHRNIHMFNFTMIDNEF